MSERLVTAFHHMDLDIIYFNTIGTILTKLQPNISKKYKTTGVFRDEVKGPSFTESGNVICYILHAEQNEDSSKNQNTASCDPAILLFDIPKNTEALILKGVCIFMFILSMLARIWEWSA